MKNYNKKDNLLIFLLLTIIIFCGFKPGTNNIQQYFKSIKPNDIEWIEVKDKLKTTTLTSLMDTKEHYKLTRFFNREWKNIKPGKLQMDTDDTKFMVMNMVNNDKITIVVSNKGCWFYYPFKKSKKIAVINLIIRT